MISVELQDVVEQAGIECSVNDGLNHLFNLAQNAAQKSYHGPA